MRAFLSALLLLCAVALSARAETLDSIPRLRPGTWSVDTTGKISSATRAEVDRLGEEVQRQGHGQLAVVVVKTTGGQAPRAFATTLFNRWGLGRTGRDDGTLLFIALNDRKAEIVLGDGVDSSEDTQRSDALMSGEIVPAFKRGSPEGAVLAGARGLSRLLEQSPLNRPESPPEDPVAAQSASSPQNDLLPNPGDDGHRAPPPMIDESTWSRTKDSTKSKNAWAWVVGVGWFAAVGIGWFTAMGMSLRRWLRRRPRHCADCKSRRLLLSETADDAHLDEGQRKEEHLGSVDYDVWWCEPCQNARVERHGAWFTLYGRCPQCAYKTKEEESSTVRAATYDHGGTVRVNVHCKHCDYRNSFTRSTSKLTRPSSSSSSRSSSSSSSGGRSSGGGSSGSW